MSRLIDADELIKNIDYSADMGGVLGKVVECVKYYAKFMVASAPTIEERKTGKWIETDSYEPCWFKCDQCGRLSDIKEIYCPTCGASMVNTTCGADMRGED